MGRSIKKIIFLLLLMALSLRAAIGQTDSIAILEAMIPDAESNQELNDIYFSLADKLFTTQPEKGTDYAFKALHYARLMNDENAMAGAYIALSLNLNYLGYPDSALPFARKAYQIMQQGEAGEYAFSSINTLGNIYDELSNQDSTLYYYYEALEYAQEHNVKSNLAAAYNNLGMTLADRGEIQKSYEYYLLALEQFEAAGDMKNAAIALNNIATLNQQNREYRKSIGYLIRASEINKEIGDNYHLSMNYSNLGISYKELESYDTALVYYQKSQEIVEEYGFKSDYARYYFNLGNLYFKSENYDSARVYFEKSIEVSEKQGVKLGLLYNHLRLFDLFIMNGKLRNAKESLIIIEDAINETGKSIFTDELLKRKSEYYEEKGDAEKALKFYKEYYQFTDSIQNLDYRNNVANLQEKYETEKKSRENQQLRDQNLIKDKTIQNQRLTGILIAVSLFLVIIIAVTLFLSRRKLSRANSALKKLNQKTFDQKQMLQEANATKDKMFSIIAHDLRSPFNTLLGFLDLLVSEFDDLDDEEKMGLLNTLNLQSKKTYGLLENLLQWSMMQRGLVKLHIEDFNLHQIVRGQINDLSQRAEIKKIEIVNRVDKSMEVKADELMIKTILRNLINNAIKFSQEGKQIKIKAEKKSDILELCVEDQGVGMTQAYADKLFTKQIPDSKPGTGNERGSGLGLRIVKDFVDMMNGEVHVESSPGKGARFCVKISQK